MSVVINTELIELVIDGTTILMQGDPSMTPEFDTLMELKTEFKTKAQREKAQKQLTEALGALAHSPEDAETLAKLQVGPPTLRRAAIGYVQAVTGFPTQPPLSSTTR